MRTIRRGCFETNSSSTHCLTVVMEEDFEAWQSGKVTLNLQTGRVDEKNGDEDHDYYTVNFKEFEGHFEFSGRDDDVDLSPKTFELSNSTKVVSFGYNVPY